MLRGSADEILPNFPLITSSNKQKQDDSSKSLYKNDSESSEEMVPSNNYMVSQTKRQIDAPAMDEIKRFIQKADLLNRNNFRKAKEEAELPQFPRQDRSSASLYKSSNNIGFTLDRVAHQERNINKVYLKGGKNNKLQQKRRIYRVPTHKKATLSNKEVQTDMQKYRIEQNEEEPMRYERYYEKMAETIIPKRVQIVRKSVPLQRIKEDDEETLPIKKTSNRYRPNQTISEMGGLTTYRASERMDFTLKNLAKIEHNFAKTIHNINDPKPKRESPNQPTVFYRKVQQNKPYLPPNDGYIDNDSTQKGSGDSKVTKDSSIFSLREMKSQTPQSQLMEMITEKEEATSISHYQQSRTANKAVQVHQQTCEFYVQVPSIPELKIQQQSTQTLQNKNHPIHNNLEQKDIDWIVKKYKPKSNFLDKISIEKFQIKKYKNGVYFGELNEAGMKTLSGIVFYYNGRIYEGQFVQDVKEGKGYQLYPDGSFYKGEFHKGVREGHGTFQWANKQIYDGQWHHGKKHGSGMWKGPQDESYIGEWHNGKVDGFGVFTTKDRARYEGEFKNSLKHGLGTERFQNGETYVGSYQKNRPNGEGQYFWSNGDYYKGDFSNGLRHGNGSFTDYKSGLKHKGSYRNDKRCGQGELQLPDGSIYIGNFQNDLRHGYGEVFEGQNKLQSGYWINDEPLELKTKPNTPILSPPETESSKSSKQRETGKQEIVTQDIRKPQNERVQKIVIQSKPKGGFVSSRSRSPYEPRAEVGDFSRPCGCNKKH